MISAPIVAVSGPDNAVCPLSSGFWPGVGTRRPGWWARSTGTMPVERRLPRMEWPRGGWTTSTITEHADVPAASYLARHAAITPDDMRPINRRPTCVPSIDSRPALGWSRPRRAPGPVA